jgi:cell wall assembly regulator SMI1
MNEELTWEFTSEPLLDEIIQGVEMLLGVQFPPDYRDCLKQNHGAQPLESDFDLEAPDGKMWGSFGLLLTVSPYAQENVFASLHYVERIQNVIPIVAEGGGNFICLDYPGDRTRANPTIVYYDHEVNLEDNFFFLCASFEEL